MTKSSVSRLGLNPQLMLHSTKKSSPKKFKFRQKSKWVEGLKVERVCLHFIHRLQAHKQIMMSSKWMLCFSKLEPYDLFYSMVKHRAIGSPIRTNGLKMTT